MPSCAFEYKFSTCAFMNKNGYTNHNVQTVTFFLNEENINLVINID